MVDRQRVLFFGVGAGAAAGSSSMGTRRIPQMEQSPGLRDTTVGCIGQWYLATPALAAAPNPPVER
jgi:hypothetical protein